MTQMIFGAPSAVPADEKDPLLLRLGSRACQSHRPPWRQSYGHSKVGWSTLDSFITHLETKTSCSTSKLETLQGNIWEEMGVFVMAPASFFRWNRLCLRHGQNEFFGSTEGSEQSPEALDGSENGGLTAKKLLFCNFSGERENYNNQIAMKLVVKT